MPQAQLDGLTDHVAHGDGMAAVVAVLDLHLLRARVIADQPDLDAAPHTRAGAHRDPLAAVVEAQARLPARRLARVVQQLLHRVGLGAGRLGGAVDDDLGRIDVAQAEVAVEGALPVGELGLGESVLPAQIVPVVHRPGQDHQAGAVRQAGHERVRLAAGRAALGGEQLDHHGRLGWRMSGLGCERRGQDGGASQDQENGPLHRAAINRTLPGTGFTKL